jgi:hypothetical protein
VLPTSPREPMHAGLQPASAQPRRSRAGRRDPLEPKQNKTPFNFFSIDARSKAKAEHPSADQKVIAAPSFYCTLSLPKEARCVCR